MKKFVRLLFASAMLLTSVSANAIPILVASGSSSGSMYNVYDAYGINWDDANDFAVLQGGHLATITDVAENTFVLELVDDVAGLGQVWAGGFQDAPGAAADNWNWVTGESWIYTNWNAGEPNDAGGPNNEQHLGIVWTPDGKWNDEANLGNIYGFVVEKAIPEPSVIALFGLGLLGLGFARRRKA